MKKIILAPLFIILIFIIGCADKIKETAEEKSPEQETQVVPEEEIQELPMDEGTEEETQTLIEEEKIKNEEQKPETPAWKEGSVAIAGKYADADFVDLGNGKFRMYYSLEPEVPGFNGQVYSALSSDGINWNNENGERIDGATFPSVIKTSDGKYRMYFQNAGVIKSAISNDGLSWKEESGSELLRAKAHSV